MSILNAGDAGCVSLCLQQSRKDTECAVPIATACRNHESTSI